MVKGINIYDRLSKKFYYRVLCNGKCLTSTNCPLSYFPYKFCV